MVRVVHKAYLTQSGGTIHTHTRKHIVGSGYGSVLLNGGIGGPGVGSSYSSIDDYINTTGVNPHSSSRESLGKGIKSINSKIESLLVKSHKHNPKKEKNINFNI